MKLKKLNTFSIDVSALRVIEVYTEDNLLVFWNNFVKKGILTLLLGVGSNVLFLEDYNGIILLNRIKGIRISESENFWYLHVCSGELWHDLVMYSLKMNMPGLENLALIPGCVGAAPIQNIGAYGVELQRFCEYVDVLNLDSNMKIRFMGYECQFSYRNSIFNSGVDFNYAIVAVGLKLHKNWRPVLNYDGLNQFDLNNVTPLEIFNTVCMMREKKIPNPLIFGNAGSFFKNPVINKRFMRQLLNEYPDMPIYIYKNNLVKLSAKWLIDHCFLKRFEYGKAAVYKDQSSILINVDQKATPNEIIRLSLYIYNEVAKRFHIFLEPEVRFIANFGKIDGIKLLSQYIS